MAPYHGIFTLVVTVLLQNLFSQTYGRTLYVRPTSTNTSCSMYPCLTLSEYAQDHENYLHNSVVMLQFLPGLHTLSRNLVIENIERLEFLGHPGTTPTMIVCMPYFGFSFSNISEVRITSLAFASCARKYQILDLDNDDIHNISLGVYLELSQMAEIVDCKFQGSFGTALGLFDSHVSFTGNNSFLNNNCTKCSDGGCSYNDPNCYGGGVYVQRSSLSFSGISSFIGNAAYYGGGISLQSSNVTISGNSTFSGNSASYGGGIFVQSSNVTINGNSTFSGNCASYGGGIFVQSYSCVVISGTTSFINNSAHQSGGGVYAETNSILKINESTTFIHNSAGFGGGVYAWSSSSVSMSGNTTFLHNSAEFHAGGIYALFSNDVNISGTAVFIDNSAGLLGGGVFARNVDNIIISGNTTLIGNSATNGGGIYAWSLSNMNITGTTTFHNNSASKHGGGLYARDHNGVNIYGIATFAVNSAGEDGGGVYAAYSNTMDISGNATFIGNSAGGNGGGVFAQPNCNVNLGGNTSFNINSANSGGGVCVKDSGMLLNGNVTFSGNEAKLSGGGVYAESSNLNFSGDTTFRNNSALQEDGGGMLLKNTSLTLEKTVCFEYCSATRAGGAICALESVLSTHGRNVFVSNLAHRGGAIYTSKCFLTFTTTSVFTIGANVAELDGGGIYVDSSHLDCNGNITIANNIAEVGGGIYSDNNTLNINGRNVVKGNVAGFHGGGIYMRRTPLHSTGNNSFSANSAREGGGIYATVNSTLDFDGGNSFRNNHAYVSGGGVWLDNSNLTMKGNSCFVDSVASYEGGGIFAYASTVYLIGNSAFISNSATTGGGIHVRWSYTNIAASTTLKYNVAVFGGGIFTDNSTFDFNGSSSFRGNHASYTGGGIYAARSNLNFFGTSSATYNYAERDGGVLYTRDGCTVNLHGLNTYVGNLAEGMGGGIAAFGTTLNVAEQNMFNDNKAEAGGGLYAVNCIVSFPGENTFSGNSAIHQGGGFATVNSVVHSNGSIILNNNSAHSGGGMYIDNSTVHVDGSNYCMNDTANSEGGAIYIQASVVEFRGKHVFIANSAGSKGGSVFALHSSINITGNSSIRNSVSTRGGAIHISFTTLSFQGRSSFMNNSAKLYGGAVQSENSELIFVNTGNIRLQPCINCQICNGISNVFLNSFISNTAIQGGALYLDQYSNTSLDQTTCVHFQNNEATDFGGAIYVVDVSSSGHFLPQQHTPSRSECFFHILGEEGFSDLETPPLVFENNSAGMRGSAVYGGLLSLCNFNSVNYASALDFFNRSILPGREHDVGFSISSDPTQICFCDKNEWNCIDVVQSRRIYPGQDIEVSAIAVDQSDVAIPSLILGNLRLGRDQDSYVSESILYETGGNCTSRNYPVSPMNHFNQLELHPSNRSGNTIHITVNIIFENCPIGFEPSNFSGVCICDQRLWQFTNSCNINTQTIQRTAGATFWLGVSYNNRTPVGFIYHHHCPLDYCNGSHSYINLKNPNDQCNFNRSGLLCGECIEGFSLMLGSSQCKKCSNKHLALLIPFALAGILLVILLFLLQLTVATGTIHGLIFYANIVSANHHIFIPQSAGNPATIFIAWLNLDLGIETCFYDGLDGFARYWLEFVFPVYVWGIVGVLVYISERSTIVTKLLGSSAVPVLATLFLLSYAKLLRIVIVALSLTILYYPHSSEIVWIQDANIPLTKYIFVVLVALLFFFFLFVPYTLLLLLGQWLQPKSHLRLLSWVRNPKLKAILDSYYAPYKQNHRYWIGLLLLVRCALFLVFAFNVSGNDSVNLLIIGLTALAISVAFALLGMVYKNIYLNALELSFILNLGVLAISTYHVNLSDGSQAAVGYTSVSVTFLTFVGIVSYHIFLRIKSKLQYIQRGRQLQHGKSQHHESDEKGHPENLQHQHPTVIANPTTTVVDLRELRSPLDLLDSNDDL